MHAQRPAGCHSKCLVFLVDSDENLKANMLPQLPIPNITEICSVVFELFMNTDKMGS